MKSYITASICFIVGLMCLMLNVLTDVFSVLFSLFMAVGLGIIFVKKIIEYKEFNEDLLSTKESVAINMTILSVGSVTDKDASLTKEQLKEFKRLKKNKKLTLWALFILLLLMVILAYKLITK